MYTLWWHKPLCPEEPIVLKGGWVNALCAYMYMSSEMSGFFEPKAAEHRTMAGRFFASFDWEIHCKLPEMEYMSYHEPGWNESANGDSQLSRSRFKPAAERCLPETIFRKTREAQEFKKLPHSTGDKPSPDSNDQIRVSRWILATKAVEEYPCITLHYRSQPHTIRCTHFRSEELLRPYASNSNPKGLLLSLDRPTLQTVFWLPSFLYGALHLVAWKEHFPSTTEKWLWRSSSIYICSCTGLWLVVSYGLYYGTRAWGPGRRFYRKLKEDFNPWWWQLLMNILGYLLSFGWPVAVGLFLLARYFIVVEAFISIRNLPAKAYDTPSWIQILPHF